MYAHLCLLVYLPFSVTDNVLSSSVKSLFGRITETEWARFEEYSGKIKSFTITSTTETAINPIFYAYISQYRGSLLPKIKYLFVTLTNFLPQGLETLLFHLAVPTLEFVQVSTTLNASIDHTIFLNAIQLAQCTGLRNFVLREGIFRKDASDILLSFKSLKRIQLQGPLRLTAEEYCHFLENLGDNKELVDLSLLSLPLPPPQLSLYRKFAALKVLHLAGPPVSVMQIIYGLQVTRKVEKITLNLTCRFGCRDHDGALLPPPQGGALPFSGRNPFITWQDATALLSYMAERWSQTLTSLQLSFFCQRLFQISSSSSAESLLRPLTAFRRLEVLELETHGSLQPFPLDFWQVIGASFPHIQNLSLPPYANAPLRTLHSLVTSLPHLHTLKLGLSIAPDEIPPLAELPVLSHRLKVLGVGNTKFPTDKAQGDLVVRHLFRMFPQLEDICGAMAQGWKDNALRVLSLCRQLIMDEADRRPRLGSSTA
ncbi:hypothetical protein AX16_000665 [Volvariella volvacea WC 439]|nr:hypothetical protein AX16_000665 [Volvariella volvacea WC 439]